MLLSLLLAGRVLAASAAPATSAAPAVSSLPSALPAQPAVARDNPLLHASELPFHYPPFDKITDADFRPAFEAGMARQRKEVEAIANNPQPPTFDNTIVALERSGRLLTRVSQVFFNLNASNTDDEMQKIEAEMSPKLAAHQDAIMLNPALFARVESLYKSRDSLGLDPESAQLLDRYYQNFLRSGARLSETDKAELKKINEEISSLMTRFEQNLLKATKAGAVVVDDVKELDGFSAEQIGAAAQAAKARGLSGKWVITLQNTTIQPPLEQLKNRALRERIYKASISRADGGPYDNTAVVARIVVLRARKAALLGYPNFAAYSLADEGARTPEAVNKMLAGLSRAALRKARGEAADIQKLIDRQAKAAHTRPFRLEPWDWAFYARQVRKARYDFGDAQVKPYFELDHVLKDGVFYAAHELYGITFKERTDLPVYRAGVRVFDIFDADGSPLGLLIRDDFKRDNKNGGAWMDAYVSQSGLFDQKPVIVNNLNIPQPPPGQPVLLTFDEVTTMFHEFGHALHGLFSNVKYPLLAGTSVPPDFVEYPSQFNEMWARDPQVVAHFAKDYRTGAPMPKELLDKVIAAQNYGEGYATAEYLEAAILDQAWHQITAKQAPKASGVMAFERRALKRAGVAYAPVPPRYHTPYFAHAFDEGYEAAYYAYVWSEVLARDTGHWFHTHGGISRANGDFFRAKILSRGRTLEPGVLFEQFYGRPPEIGPLLKYRDLAMPTVKGKN
ncbi:MAG: M3 family metallopeptidase [Elusimicrobia bacterium]|nr:M3 family metallopeptidase [Elusimicrobiota bacterium]MDE2426809.1 M3 family metallopeptidase [Elusimicrobiota bacterium]